MLPSLFTMLATITVQVPAEAPSTTRPAGRPGAVGAWTYKSTKEADLKIHVHFPADWKPGDRRPAVLFFFGGGWRQGSVEQFAPQAEHLARRGMVAARADYRVYNRHRVSPDRCVEDALSAARWFRRHARDFGIDPDRIAAAGGSAGGHLAACTALLDGPTTPGEDTSISSRTNALVLFNPVLDMLHERIIERVGNNETLAKAISPYHHLRKSAPPTLILFGTADTLMAQALPYIEKAKELGNRVELYTAEGAKHGFFNKPPWYEPTLQRMDDFLVEIGYLRPAASRPAMDADRAIRRR